MSRPAARCTLRRCLAFAALLVGLLAPAPAAAQQKIGYIDSEYILGQLPEYATVQQRLDRLSQQWEGEIEEQQSAVSELVAEFEARRLLYTDEERQRRQEEIGQARQDVENLRQRYFGPDGELYRRQKDLVRPIQERVLGAVDAVARGEGYDYVLDKSGPALFMYANENHDLTDEVLDELGIDVESPTQQSE